MLENMSCTFAMIQIFESGIAFLHQVNLLLLGLLDFGLLPDGPPEDGVDGGTNQHGDDLEELPTDAKEGDEGVVGGLAAHEPAHAPGAHPSNVQDQKQNPNIVRDLFVFEEAGEVHHADIHDQQADVLPYVQ